MICILQGKLFDTSWQKLLITMFYLLVLLLFFPKTWFTSFNFFAISNLRIIKNIEFVCLYQQLYKKRFVENCLFEKQLVRFEVLKEKKR